MECGDKEWQHCQVEKMGCPGCYYDEIKNNKIKLLAIVTKEQFRSIEYKIEE